MASPAPRPNEVVRKKLEYSPVIIPPHFGSDKRMLAKPAQPKEDSFWDIFCAVNSPLEDIVPYKVVVSGYALGRLLRGKANIRNSFARALLESGALKGAGSYGRTRQG